MLTISHCLYNECPDLHCCYCWCELLLFYSFLPYCLFSTQLRVSFKINQIMFSFSLNPLNSFLFHLLWKPTFLQWSRGLYMLSSFTLLFRPPSLTFPPFCLCLATTEHNRHYPSFVLPLLPRIFYQYTEIQILIFLRIPEYHSNSIFEYTVSFLILLRAVA